MNSIRLVSAVILREPFEKIGGFDGSLFGSEDWAFWVHFAAQGFRMAHLAEPLVERRLHKQNLSRSHAQERLRESLHIVESMAFTYPILSDLVPYRHSLLLRQIIISSLLANEGSRVRREIRQLANINHDYNRVVGAGFWLLSFLGPLQAPLVKTLLSLIRATTPQGGSKPPLNLP